jgi:hypothetical protein
MALGGDEPETGSRLGGFVMPNTLAPQGLMISHRLGAAPNYQISRRWVSPNNPTPIFQGDPVVQLSTGYLAQAAPGVTQIAGVFLGCEYMSIGQRKIFGRNWWGGGDAVAGLNVSARVIDDPLSVFRIQGNGLITFAMIGMNAQFAIGVGNQANGMSGATLDVVTNPPAVTATFPLRIIDLITDPPGANGTDTTTPYNWAYVTFNNQDFKALTGI